MISHTVKPHVGMGKGQIMNNRDDRLIARDTGVCEVKNVTDLMQ
jgi:hypothetical protein